MRPSLRTKSSLSLIQSVCNNENGAALVIGLMFLAILAMLGTTAVVMTTTDMQIGANYKSSMQALNDAEAGIYYAIGKIEEGLKAWPRTFTLPTSTVPSTPLLSSLPVPTGFRFTYQTTGTSTIFDITEVSTDPDIYKYTVNGTGPQQKSSVVLEVQCERLPAIRFGAFGDEKVDLKNSSSIYAYSHTTNPTPDIAAYPTGFEEGEADAGSNVAVNLDTGSLVDGNIGLGEDATGTDAGDVTGQGTFNGTAQDIPRVTPDPLGVVGGEYAALFTTYSDPANNDNSLAVDPDGQISAGPPPSINIGNAKYVVLKGKTGGANYYFHDILVGNKAALYIDTINGSVNIFLTGRFNATTGSEIVVTSTTPLPCCTVVPVTGLDCSGCTIVEPGKFSIFANSQDSSDEIVINNGVKFSGLIYAPYLEIEMKNSADIYGALFGKTVEMNNGANLFFDVDMKDEMVSNDLAIISWRDNRM